MDVLIIYKRIYYLMDSLKRISKFATLNQLKKGSNKNYGLEYVEALEMAYDNIRIEAKNALKNYKKIKK